METKEHISKSQMIAYLDKSLLKEDYFEVENTIQKNAQLSQRFFKIKNELELIKSYIPLPKKNSNLERHFNRDIQDSLNLIYGENEETSLGRLWLWIKSLYS